MFNTSCHWIHTVKSGYHRAIDRDNLIRWFAVEWRPLENKIVMKQNLWSVVPAYQHLLVVYVEPAVAERGPSKK